MRSWEEQIEAVHDAVTRGCWCPLCRSDEGAYYIEKHLPHCLIARLRGMRWITEPSASRLIDPDDASG